MGRLQHLKQTLPFAVRQPLARCIVVDYACPDRCGDWVERQFPQVTVVRHIGATHFNRSHARNLGARAATARWLAFVDADVQLAPRFTESIAALLQPRHFYRAKPFADDLMGTVVCSRADFDRAGGWDEVMQGWGAEDFDFFNMLRFAGSTERYFPARLVRTIAHSHSMRVRYHQTKKHWLSLTVNDLYSRAKLDLMRLRQGALHPEARVELYDAVSRLVRRSLESDRDHTLQFVFRSDYSWLGSELTCRVLFTLQGARAARRARRARSRRSPG